MLLALLRAQNLSNPLPVSCFVAVYRVGQFAKQLMCKYPVVFM